MPLKELRTLVVEEVERNMRWLAGFSGVAGIGRARKGELDPLPGSLGSPEEQEAETDKDEQEELPSAVRATDRAGGPA